MTIVAQTETDHFVLQQLQPVLQPGEQVAACAYLRPIVEGRMSSFVHAATRMAAFAALTDRRLLLVQTRIGAFKPLLENHGVVAFERASVKGVAMGQRLVVELVDGQLLEFQHEPSLKGVSTQAEFFRQLQQAFPTSVVGASHLASQRRLQVVGTAVGIVIALLYVWWKLR
ncbi:MAG TPA: hypothetical protein VF316_01575 [Polyangiaceae bacterium]